MGTPAAAPAQIQQGGTLNYAADQEPTGFNNNTSKDNRHRGGEHRHQHLSRSAFHLHPDFTVKMNDDFLDSAELTSEDPQTVVYKIKQNAVWSDGTPVTADDFIYLWENCNGTNKNNDVVSTTGYDHIESVTGSDSGKTVTIVYKNKFADWKSLFASAYILPAHYVEGAAGRLEHRARQEPGEDPLGRPVHGRVLHPGPEPDPDAQRQVLRDQGPP